MNKAVKQWLLSFISVVGVFVTIGIVGNVIADILNIWGQPIVGFLSAFGVVLVSYILAPDYKRAAAVFTFVIGAGLAWYFLESSHYPESYAELAYQPTIIPLAVKLTGGVVGLLLCWMLDKAKTSN